MQSKLYDQGFPQGFSNRGGRDYNRPIFQEKYAVVFCYFSNFTGGVQNLDALPLVHPYRERNPLSVLKSALLDPLSYPMKFSMDKFD